MSGPHTVLGIAGSLREGSYNRALLRAAAEVAPERVEVLVWEGLHDVPPYDQDADVQPAPGPVAGLRRVLEACEAGVLDEELAVGNVDERIVEGRLIEPDARRRLAEILDRLVVLTGDGNGVAEERARGSERASAG